MNTKTQITPGPWFLAPLGRELYVEADNKAQFICDMQLSACMGDDEVAAAKANALAIAAVPDLIAGLRGTLAIIEAYIGTDEVINADIVEAVREAQNALQKAGVGL